VGAGAGVLAGVGVGTEVFAGVAVGAGVLAGVGVGDEVFVDVGVGDSVFASLGVGDGLLVDLCVDGAEFAQLAKAQRRIMPTIIMSLLPVVYILNMPFSDRATCLTTSCTEPIVNSVSSG